MNTMIEQSQERLPSGARRPRRFLRILLVLLIAVLLVVWYLRSDIHHHNWFRSQLKTSLAAVPVPPETFRLRAIAELGLLVGNGNHCDYFISEIHTTKRTPGDILQYYRGRTLPNPERPNECFHLKVAFYENGQLPNLDLGVKLPELKTDAGLHYVLYVFLNYHEAGNDPRCH